VPFVDFPEQFRRQEAQLMPLIHDVLSKGDLVMRSQMRSFEENLAAFVEIGHAVGVSNCTDALRLLAEALDIGTGDEVVTVSHTFVATMSPFKLRGATPVLVDIAHDHLLDVEQLPAALSERTKMVLPVHLNGRVCDMVPILEAAGRVGAVVVEDAAQALGARYYGRASGSMGLASVFSFYPAKLLGAFGDAGALVTDDASLADEIRLLRDHGRRGKEELATWGYNCRLDNLQAAILDLRLTMLPAWIERRRELAARYEAKLADVATIDRLPGPDSDPRRYDVFQNYPVLVEDRDRVVAGLTEAGIETLVSWRVPNHRQPGLGLDFELPRTETLSEHVVSLPLFPELSDEQVDYVADTITALVAD